MPGFHITAHALERFQERLPGNQNPHRAAKKLQSLADGAYRVGQRHSGERYYRNGPVLLVVKEKTVVTVYAADLPYAA